jgi:sulfur relay (sulfurtransferase) DsrF/TusC family protein
MKIISKLILLVGITAMVGCSKQVAVIPINGNWNITNVSSNVTIDPTLNVKIAVDCIELYGNQYQWYISDNSLIVKDNNNNEFTYAIEKIDNTHFRLNGVLYEPIVNVITNGNNLICEFNLYPDLYVCGIKYSKAITNHLELTLSK